LAFVSVLAGAGCSSSAGSPASSDLVASEGLSAAPSYESIVDLVRTRNIRSIDALLGQPEFPRSYLRGFTSVFKSRSIQYADPLNPRIVVYGEDAKLVLAFTCATGDCVALPGGATGPVAGGEHLEIVQWRESSKSFEYRDITFPEGNTGEVTLSEPNPQRCLACHGASDPRPNWEPYNQWPGMYGGDDDGAQPGRLVEGESRESLDRFLATGPQRPRYRWLNDLVDGYQYLYDSGGVHYAAGRTNKNHNIDLNEALYLLNDERIVDRIRKLPFYEDIKYALRLGLSGASLSDPLRALGQTELAGLVDQCTSTGEPASRVIRLLYGLGVDSLPWFLSFGPNVKSELRAPAFSVESQVENALDALDSVLTADRDELSRKALEGWTRILAARPVHDGLARCAAEQSAPRP
jgi:hypothetical protein